MPTTSQKFLDPAFAKEAVQAALDHATRAEQTLTPKQHVLIADPEAQLDYYELLRGAGKPCWFIRRGCSGNAYTLICANPRAAWKAAYDNLVAALRMGAA